MADSNSNISIIALNVKDLNISVKIKWNLKFKKTVMIAKQISKLCMTTKHVQDLHTENYKLINF